MIIIIIIIIIVIINIFKIIIIFYTTVIKLTYVLARPPLLSDKVTVISQPNPPVSRFAIFKHT